jgi:hypothetical protein
MFILGGERVTRSAMPEGINPQFTATELFGSNVLHFGNIRRY